MKRNHTGRSRPYFWRRSPLLRALLLLALAVALLGGCTRRTGPEPIADWTPGEPLVESPGGTSRWIRWGGFSTIAPERTHYVTISPYSSSLSIQGGDYMVYLARSYQAGIYEVAVDAVEPEESYDPNNPILYLSATVSQRFSGPEAEQLLLSALYLSKDEIAAGDRLLVFLSGATKERADGTYQYVDRTSMFCVTDRAVSSMPQDLAERVMWVEESWPKDAFYADVKDAIQCLEDYYAAGYDDSWHETMT